MKALQRIFKDLRQRRNLEIYLYVLVALPLFAVGLVADLIPINIQLSVIIAALTLLVFNISVPKQEQGNLDDYLNDRDAFPPLKERLKNAQTLEIFAPSAVNILNGDNLHVMLETVLAHRSGVLRVVILDINSADGVSVAKRQLDDAVDIQVQELHQALLDTRKQFANIERNRKEGTFEYGFLDYNPGFSMVVIDGDKSSGVIILEIQGFKNISTRKRMNIEIRRATSETWYNYWLGQMREIWKDSKK